MADIDRIKIPNDSTVYNIKDVTARNGLNGKQDVIDNNHKLSADLVDDTNATHKFATATQLSQIQTNANDILTLQQQRGAVNTALEEVL